MTCKTTSRKHVKTVLAIRLTLRRSIIDTHLLLFYCDAACLITKCLKLFCICRVMWIFTVLAALLCFVVQVGIRLQDYYKFESNIDVTLTFNSSISFPALTFCNQNAFRMTKTVDTGLYYFIDYAYSADNISGI